MELFHFPLMCVRKTLELKDVCLESLLESFDTGIVKEFKKVSVLSGNLLKTTCSSNERNAVSKLIVCWYYRALPQ